MKKLYMFKLGSESKGFIPNKKMFEEFRFQLKACILNGGDVNVLLTHPFVQLNVVDVPEDMKLGIAFDTSWEEMEKRHEEEMEKVTKDFEGRYEAWSAQDRSLRASLAEAKKPWWKKLFGKK